MISCTERVTSEWLEEASGCNDKLNPARLEQTGSLMLLVHVRVVIHAVFTFQSLLLLLPFYLVIPPYLTMSSKSESLV